MAELIGIEETSNLVVSGIKSYQAIVAAKNNDGKFSWSDLTLLVPVIPDYMKAISGIGGEVAELKDLSADELNQLSQLVATQLGASVDAALMNKIQKVLIAIKADYDAVRAFV